MCVHSLTSFDKHESIYSIPDKIENISFPQKSSLRSSNSTHHHHPTPTPTNTHIYTEATSALIFITIVYFACSELYINEIAAHVLVSGFSTAISRFFFYIHTCCYMYLKIFIPLYVYTIIFLSIFLL